MRDRVIVQTAYDQLTLFKCRVQNSLSNWEWGPVFQACVAGGTPALK